ncbi:SYCE3 protein, partial [Ptilonorhynchus violaceus]|nr:SYCE3 protein [Ptilonorhynchus violaceus]
MAESDPREGNYDNREKMSDLKRDLEKVLEEMEELTVRAALMAYDMVAMRTHPELTSSLKHMEDAFLRCKGQVEKKWQEEPME